MDPSFGKEICSPMRGRTRNSPARSSRPRSITTRASSILTVRTFGHDHRATRLRSGRERRPGRNDRDLRGRPGRRRRSGDARGAAARGTHTLLYLYPRNKAETNTVTALLEPALHARGLTPALPGVCLHARHPPLVRAVGVSARDSCPSGRCCREFESGRVSCVSTTGDALVPRHLRQHRPRRLSRMKHVLRDHRTQTPQRAGPRPNHGRGRRPTVAPDRRRRIRPPPVRGGARRGSTSPRVRREGAKSRCAERISGRGLRLGTGPSAA